MRPWSLELRGRLERHEVDSRALEDNPLGDSPRRPLQVYLPPSYDERPEARFPVVYVLQGYGASVASWALAPSSFEPTYAEEADELFASSRAPECMLVFVDAWTSLGGSQFVDSPAVGAYHTYLVEDVVGYVDSRFRTLASPRHRGVQGKSSGGLGALVTAMWRPDLFGALASHSGDGSFELSLLPLVAEAYRALREGYGGDYERFFEEFHGRRAFSAPSDFPLLLCYALAACYSPSALEPDGVALPFEPSTGRLREDVWLRWLELDPVRMAPRYLEALAGLRGIWIDAGRSDEHYLDVAADSLSAVLAAAGVEHRYELYPGGHRGTAPRYALALGYLAERLAPST